MANRKTFTGEEARQIGEALGIDWSEFDVEQYRIGLNVELEHGLVDSHTNVTNDDPMMTGKIALAHLKFQITTRGLKRWKRKPKVSKAILRYDGPNCKEQTCN